MIIAPYHAQVMKIRDILGRDTKTKDIEVGSVEEFQGQVGIYSTYDESRH